MSIAKACFPFASVNQSVVMFGLRPFAQGLLYGKSTSADFYNTFVVREHLSAKVIHSSIIALPLLLCDHGVRYLTDSDNRFGLREPER